MRTVPSTVGASQGPSCAAPVTGPSTVSATTINAVTALAVGVTVAPAAETPPCGGFPREHGQPIGQRRHRDQPPQLGAVVDDQTHRREADKKHRTAVDAARAAGAALACGETTGVQIHGDRAENQPGRTSEDVGGEESGVQHPVHQFHSDFRFRRNGRASAVP